MLPHLLTNFEIQKYYQNEPKSDSVYSRNNLTKIKDGSYVINFDNYNSMGTHWITLNVNGNNRRASYDAIYFESFRSHYIPKEIKKFMRNKNIIVNIYRIQAYDLAMCEYFCVGIIDFMLKCKSLFDCTNLCSPNDYEKNDKKIFSITKKTRKLYCFICAKYRTFENLKYHTS